MNIGRTQRNKTWLCLQRATNRCYGFIATHTQMFGELCVPRFGAVWLAMIWVCQVWCRASLVCWVILVVKGSQECNRHGSPCRSRKEFPRLEAVKLAPPWNLEPESLCAGSSLRKIRGQWEFLKGFPADPRQATKKQVSSNVPLGLSVLGPQ